MTNRTSTTHAVVLGAGMAGLFAARVLSENFDRVTVIDRDALFTETDPRRGVPQGRHVHGFQARGVQIVGQLFPGLVEEMSAAGASLIGDLRKLHFRINGHLLSQQPKAITPVLLATRPYLEACVRNRVAAIGAVTFWDCLEVSGLLHERTPDGRVVVTGVRVTPRGGGAVDDVPADLVVDASGRGSRTPHWLAELGYQRPAEEKIAVRVQYASQTVRLPGTDHRLRFLIDGRTVDRDFGVALFGCERDQWVFTVMGAERRFPEVTREWMLAAADVALPEWAAQALRAAEPLGQISAHRHPASVRRRYDRLDSFPDGLVVTGDAMCAFNPIYGLGMSVAAEQALALRACLRRGVENLAPRFYRASAKPVTTAWELSAGSDLAYPEVEGTPTASMRRVGRYVERVLQVAEDDPEVARRFMAVSGLVAPRQAMFHPRILRPVLRSIVRPARVARVAAVEPAAAAHTPTPVA